MRYLLKRIEKILLVTFFALQAMLVQAQLIRIAAAFILSVLLAATFLPSSAQTIRRVTTGGTGDGSTWAAAMNLQAALAASDSLDQVWIAAGTYKPHADDRSATFSVSEGVLVYGGFVGDEADNFDHKNNPRMGAATILSGDLLNDDIARPAAGADQTAYNASRDDNSHTVVTIAGKNVTLDGLTIGGGQRGTLVVGEGFFGEDYFGAGLYAGAGTAGATLTGCTFTNNSVESGFGNSFGGGAFFGGEATLTGCTFTNNSVESGFGNSVGGGAFFGGEATLTNCVLVGNSADHGGSLWLESGGTVINSTFYNNTESTRGVGIEVTFNTDNPFILRNSILVGNTVNVNNKDANVVTLQNNLLAGGANPMGTDQGVTYRTPGSANITQTSTVDESDAMVVFASITANEDDYLHLAAGSPAVNAGNNSYIPAGIVTDATGNARIQGGTVDLGAYESNPPPHTIMLTSHTDGDSIAIAYDEVVAQTIMFSIGGGATGWTSEITGDDFITLDTDMNVAQDTGVAITVRATPTENTGMDERIATITFTTTGGGPAASATVTITQAALPDYIHAGDVVLTTQEQVDTIRNTLGSAVTVIDGYLQIGHSNDITDLSPLGFLTEITGNFFIGSVGASNSVLTNIGDFPFLQKIGGGYSVVGNPELLHGGNFPVLESIGDNLIASGNEDDQNQNAIDVLHGYFFIRSNPKLESVGTFPRLERIGTSFTARGHDSLRSLYEFPSLISIGIGAAYVPSQGVVTTNTSIVIEDNSSLSDCYTLTDFLPGGSHAVSGEVYINNNAGVCTDQNALSNTIYRGDITVTTQAEVDTLRTTLAGKTRIDGNVTIGYTDGSSRSDITDLSPLSNMTHIRGNLKIERNGVLVNLTALTHLQTIGGIFVVGFNDQLTDLGNFPALQSIGLNMVVDDNNELTTLGNFPVLQSIGGNFYVYSNDSLTTLGNFPVLTSIGTGRADIYNLGDTIDNVSIVVEDNSSLSDCYTLTDFLPGGTHAVSGEIYINNNDLGCSSGDEITEKATYTGDITVTTQAAVDALRTTLAGKTIINGNLTIGYTFGSSRGDITDLSPLSNITHITENIQIQRNPQLDNLNGLTHLQTIGGLFNVRDNSDLTDLGDFSVLQSIGGYFWVQSNSELTDLGDFPVLQTIGEFFQVIGNGKLTDLGDFPTLQTIGKSFQVDVNSELTDLGDFPVLQTIGEFFQVIGNGKLTDLGDFPILQSIGGLFMWGVIIT